MNVRLRAVVAGGLTALACLGAMSIASADWRDDVGVLRVGVPVAADDAYRIQTLEPFRVYLQDRVGIPVEILPTGGYAGLIDGQTRGQIDYAIYSATSFATASVLCDCIEAIAAPVAADGALGFYSVLVSSAYKGITTLADARGKRIALAGDDSVAGHMIPMRAFEAQGIDPREYFSKIVIVDDPRAAIEALLAGDVDVAVGWSSLTGPAYSGYDFGVLSQMVEDNVLSMGQIAIIWQSELIPFGPHAIRENLPPELKSRLVRALATVPRQDPRVIYAVDRTGLGSGGFTTPDPDLYDVVIDLVSASP